MKSYKHKDTRTHIPSSEEAGYEAANPLVQEGRQRTDLPLNPVIHRGANPELFWKNKYPVDATIGAILEKYQKRNAKKQAEYTLGIEIADEAFDRLYGHVSHPFPVKPGQKVAVRVISQFGEESTKVVGV